MNAIAAEIAIRCEEIELDFVGEHFKGDINVDCDALSRLAQGAQVPECVRKVRRSNPRKRDASFFRAWPQERRAHDGSL